MKLEKAQHKSYLYKYVNFVGGNPGTHRAYTLDKLDVAVSTSKKLVEGGTEHKVDGRVVTIEFADSSVEFSAEEWVFLKERFSEIKELPLSEATTYHDLEEVFSA